MNSKKEMLHFTFYNSLNEKYVGFTMLPNHDNSIKLIIWFDDKKKPYSMFRSYYNGEKIR